MRATARRAWRTEGLARWILLVGLVVTTVFVLFALFAPWIAPYGFDQNSSDGVRFPKTSGPGPGHLLGTNDQFYDIFSRVVWGARTAVLVVVLSVVLSAVIGVLLGLVSGYLGGWFDRITVFLMDALYSFPSLLLAIVFSFMLRERIGGSILAAALSLTAIYIPQYFRVVRNTTVAARQATYVEAAEALGARPITVMRRYLLPNVTSSVPVIGTLNAADALGTLAALGFLGLGIPPNEAADWGYDLSRALDDVAAGDLGPALWPGLAIILLVTALTLVGEGLSETLNPTLRRPRRTAVVLPARPEEAP
ncbi:ABC transporter permease [Nocardioides sp.]|uniref:ABC transporter permease n=1 Tax=Nocardioides sp. TaxID=35761 RepID=UPI003514D2B3